MAWESGSEAVREAPVRAKREGHGRDGHRPRVTWESGSEAVHKAPVRARERAVGEGRVRAFP